MMKIIKYRGVTKNGDIIVGDLTHSNITGLPKIWVNGSAINVEPESVAQFCGYDAEGNEVYEGDKRFDCEGNVVVAHLSPYFLPDKFKPDSIKHIGETFRAFHNKVNND